MNLGTHTIKGLSTAKNEIDRALYVTSIVIMPASVVKQGVMGAMKCTMVESNHVPSHKDCHRLILGGKCYTSGSIILQNPSSRNFLIVVK